MDIVELIEHPERMDRDTLYELRSLLALYPYFQTARLLMLQNLYLLHDPSFDQELRQAAIYITDRKVLFQMIEAAHYQLKVQNTQPELVDRLDADDRDSRTLSLIDDFLDSLPKDESQQEKKGKLIGQSLIDSFINNDKGKIVLNENPTLKPELDADTVDRQKEGEEGYFTETLARIYIKQGNYSKALEIIQQLSLDNPKKNAYFADQMRFLEKLIINSNKK